MFPAALTKASAILTDKVLPEIGKSFLLSPNPYAALAKVISLFYPTIKASTRHSRLELQSTHWRKFTKLRQFLRAFLFQRAPI
jgi:UDP-3-O-[3-hydroxymyristoyl] glucosamine N-acyltransferase